MCSSEPSSLFWKRILRPAGEYARDFLLARFPIPPKPPNKKFVTLAFRPVTFREGIQYEQTDVVAQGIFEPRRLIIVPNDRKLAEGIVVSSIFIGSESALSNNNPLPIESFYPDHVDEDLTFPTTCGGGITLNVAFEHTKPLRSYVPPPVQMRIAFPVKGKSPRKGARCEVYVFGAKKDDPPRRCPLKYGHKPIHEWPPLPPEPPRPPPAQVVLHAAMLGAYLPAYVPSPDRQDPWHVVSSRGL
jgi:hypothetical protein